MIFLKYFNLIIIFIICTYIGFEKAKTFDERVKELRKLKNGLNMFKAKIEFTYEPIKEIFFEISNAVYENKENIFNKIALKLGGEDVTILWNKIIEEYNGNFNKEDKEIIKMFGKLLGKTSKDGQINEINLSLNFIENQIEKAEIDKEKNIKLYKSLGAIIGCIIVIIFI